MGIKGGHRGNNRGFGNLCNLKPVITAVAEEEDIDKIPKTKILRISDEMYQKFLSHSRKFYNVESYDQILENLLNDFEYHNQGKRWRDIES